MSSPRSDPAPPVRWPPWRRLMLSGALVLLSGSLGRILLQTSWPDWGATAAYVIGYGLLAFGFIRAMGARQRAAMERARIAAERAEQGGRDAG